ncbi:hypothetical protein HZA39_00295, partial [Candidatus Peregrinibacteria bacterium]|nr:hypothetical protein [Candidatus Peregrinibacteria bacterium]
LEGAIVDRLTEIRLQSGGFAWTKMKQTVNIENLPISPSDWNIKEYKDWLNTHPETVKTEKAGEKEKKGAELSKEKELESVKNMMRQIVEEASTLAEKEGKSIDEITNIMDKLMGELPEQHLFNAKAKEIANLPTATDRNIALTNYKIEVMRAFGIKSFNI